MRVLDTGSVSTMHVQCDCGSGTVRLGNRCFLPYSLRPLVFCPFSLFTPHRLDSLHRRRPRNACTTRLAFPIVAFPIPSDCSPRPRSETIIAPTTGRGRFQQTTRAACTPASGHAHSSEVQLTVALPLQRSAPSALARPSASECRVSVPFPTSTRQSDNRGRRVKGRSHRPCPGRGPRFDGLLSLRARSSSVLCCAAQRCSAVHAVHATAPPRDLSARRTW